MPILLESKDGGTIGCTFRADGEDSEVLIQATDLDGHTIRLRFLPEVAALFGKEVANDAAETPLRTTD